MDNAHVIIESSRKYVQQIEAGRHRLTADEPASAGGEDAGPTPHQLLLSALGACTAATLRMYAERKGWELGTIRVTLALEASKEAGDRITRRLSFSSALTSEQKQRLGEIAAKTPVTQLLGRGAAIVTELA